MAFEMPPLGPYQYHEVISALRKDIKLGDVEAAVYWANVVLTYGGKNAQKTVAKQLWIMAAEDIDDPPIVARAFAVFQMAGVVPETDHLIFLVAAMCKARKWWEHEEGQEVDRLWAKAVGDLKVPERNRPIPSYALDRHTRRGWAIFKETGRFDDRFSGTDLGRQKTLYMFRRDGEISPDGQVFETRDGQNDPGFREHWREFKVLEAISKGDEEPNDPVKGQFLTAPQDALLEVEMPEPQ